MWSCFAFILLFIEKKGNDELKVELNHKLTTNDIVELIINRKQTGPDEDWLKFVKTNVAKKHIQDFFERNTPTNRFYRL